MPAAEQCADSEPKKDVGGGRSSSGTRRTGAAYLTEKPGAEGRPSIYGLSWIDDSDQAARAVTHSSLPEAKIEVVAVFAPDVAARWKLQNGEVRPPVPSL